MNVFLSIILFLNCLSNKQDSLSLAQLKWQMRCQRQIDSLAASPFLDNGFVGISVKSAKDKRSVFGYQANKSLAPASTLKLASSATAFVVLGEDYVYQTTLSYSGQIVDSVLTGNIYIKGNGDPSLGSWRFAGKPNYKQLTEIWGQKIKEAGIKRIEGQIIGDATYFDHNVLPHSWTWSDMGNYYGAGCYGLNIHENLFSVTFVPKNYMEQAGILRTNPDLPYYTKINKVLTDKAGTGDQVNIFSTPYQDILLLEGYVPQGKHFTVKGSIPDPSYFIAYSLHKYLTEKNISVSGGATSSLALEKQFKNYPPTQAPLLLHTQYSPLLKDLAKECNFHSINLYAEAFLKTASVKAGFGNTLPQALQAFGQLWQSKGVNISGLKIKDGSGLSPSNAITAETMTDLLAVMYQEKSFKAFYESIPVVGVSGTVAHLGKKSKAVGNMRAKSGSIDNVRAYAGYFTDSTGELYCFSIMLNRYNTSAGNATKELEKILILLADL